VSIIGWTPEYVEKWECNTPTALKRCKFVKLLKDDYGLWCSVRIQPIIDINEVLQLCEHLNDVNPDYVTIEHFKSIYDVHGSTEAFFKLVGNKEDYVTQAGRIQVRRDKKIENIKQIQAICNSYGIKVGVGDNDLHYMSQSRCCCGIDTIGESFDNYLKYNLTCMCTGDIPQDVFIPQCNPRKHINDQKYGLVIDYKQYVNDYIKLHPDYLGDKRNEIEKKLFGKSTKKLF
jgi:DNA repair photolyase